MNRVTAEWSQALHPDGTASLDDATFATNESQATLTINVPYHSTGNFKTSTRLPAGVGTNDNYHDEGMNLHKAIAQILGYTRYNGTGNNFLRWCPARHPIHHQLRATKIASVKGIKELRREQSPLGLLTGANLPVQIFATYQLSILFQSLTYDALADNEINTERDRYVTDLTQGRSEVLVRQGGQFYFVAGTPPGNTNPPTAFPQSIGMMVGSYEMVLNWHQVPREAIFSGMYPTKIVNLLGKVNNDEVQAGWVAEGAKIPIGGSYTPGTILFTGVVITPEQAPVAPQIMFGRTGILRTPRTYNVEYRFAVDPRGHNLKPWIGDNVWYLVTHNGHAPLDGKTIYEPVALIEELFKPL